MKLRYHSQEGTWKRWQRLWKTLWKDVREICMDIQTHFLFLYFLFLFFGCSRDVKVPQSVIKLMIRQWHWIINLLCHKGTPCSFLFLFMVLMISFSLCWSSHFFRFLWIFCFWFVVALFLRYVNLFLSACSWLIAKKAQTHF